MKDDTFQIRWDVTCVPIGLKKLLTEKSAILAEMTSALEAFERCRGRYCPIS
jgi:hypothetical protein